MLRREVIPLLSKQKIRSSGQVIILVYSCVFHMHTFNKFITFLYLLLAPHIFLVLLARARRTSRVSICPLPLTCVEKRFPELLFLKTHDRLYLAHMRSAFFFRNRTSFEHMIFHPCHTCMGLLQGIVTFIFIYLPIKL